MKKMVYFCPVDWRWIKQRPQFLAEEMSRFYQVHVIYPYSKKRKGLQKKSPTHVALTPYITLPTLSGRLRFVGGVNRWLVRLQAGMKIRCAKPDVIWITLPEQLDMIPEAYRDRIVYDCMDDYVAMNAREDARARILQEEGELVRRAKLVFATSENLRQKLCARYRAKREKIQLLRNGYNAKWQQPAQEAGRRESRLRIGYFGTISHWFDFELMMRSLRHRKDIEYHLFGPVAGGVQIPQDERMIYHGVVEHDDIERCAAQLDALMMPFVLNDIVLSVDPVKLYEYICLNKNILCVRYPEVERFASFVLFYRNFKEYLESVDRLLTDNKPVYSRTQAGRFLTENSWRCRAECAHMALTSIEHMEGKE